MRKEAFFGFLDAVVWFVLEVGVDNIVAKTRYSTVLTHTAVLRSSAIDRSQPEFFWMV